VFIDVIIERRSVFFEVAGDERIHLVNKVVDRGEFGEGFGSSFVGHSLNFVVELAFNEAIDESFELFEVIDAFVRRDAAFYGFDFLCHDDLLKNNNH